MLWALGGHFLSHVAPRQAKLSRRQDPWSSDPQRSADPPGSRPGRLTMSTPLMPASPKSEYQYLSSGVRHVTTT